MLDDLAFYLLSEALSFEPLGRLAWTRALAWLIARMTGGPLDVRYSDLGNAALAPVRSVYRVCDVSVGGLGSSGLRPRLAEFLSTFGCEAGKHVRSIGRWR
jgi:hypothetical protein